MLDNNSIPYKNLEHPKERKIEIVLKPDETLSIKKAKRPKSFYSIGKKDMNPLRIIRDLSKMEGDILLYIMENVVYEPIEGMYETTVHFVPRYLGSTKSQRDNVTRALKTLAEKQIVLEITPKRYMINPDIVIPQRYELCKHLWDTCVLARDMHMDNTSST